MGNEKLSHAAKKFRSQLGSDATVQRSTETGDHILKANAEIFKIGDDLNPVPGKVKHVGSAALHVYWNETLEQMFVVSQTTPMKGTPVEVAIAATKDFTGAMMETFGTKRPKLRSGF